MGGRGGCRGGKEHKGGGKSATFYTFKVNYIIYR